MPHPRTCFESREKGNISKSGIKRTEWKTKTYLYLELVFEICKTLKSKKLAISKIEPFLTFNSL